jgi:hypothetical protein
MIYLFDYNKIMQENTVVHCNTEEKAKKLLEWADSIGLKRHSGRSFKGVLAYTEGGTYYDLYYGYTWDISYAKLKEYTILTYEEVLLNDFDLIYRIETGGFGNRCETVYCVDWKDYTKTCNGYTFDIDKCWVSYVNSFNLIYIGNNKGKDSFTLNKTEILTAFCELGADRNWKIKVIYDGEEYVYDWKTIPQAIKAEGSPVYMTGKTSTLIPSYYDGKNFADSIARDYKAIKDTLNKKGEDIKMAGIKAKVEVVVANMNTKCEFKETVYVADEYLAYSVEDKYVKTINKEMANVKKLTIDGKVIFEYEITTTEVDTRKDWVKVRTKIAELELRFECKLIEKEDYEIERAKLYKESSKYSESIEYKVDWKLIK